MARNPEGLIGMSDPLTLEVDWPEAGKSSPYLGKAQVIPGTVIPGHFDEGGQGSAYFTYLKNNIFAKPPWNLKFRPDEDINSPDAGGISAGTAACGFVTASTSRRRATMPSPLHNHVDGQGFPSGKPDRILLDLDKQPLVENLRSAPTSPRDKTGGRIPGPCRPDCPAPRWAARFARAIRCIPVPIRRPPFSAGRPDSVNGAKTRSHRSTLSARRALSRLPLAWPRYCSVRSHLGSGGPPIRRPVEGDRE